MVTQADLTATEGRLGKRIDGGFKAVNTRLDKLNGSVQEHATAIAVLKTNEGHHDEEIRTLKGKVQALVVSTAKKAGTAMILVAAASIVVALIQFVVAPFFERISGGTP